MNHKRCCETCLNVPCKILDRVLCINQSERDKVLDNLRKFLLAYSQGLPGFVYVYNVEEWINEEELRQAGES